jgi:phosphoribosylformimino-5-aminoimidazole carboxamide ribonucleotide (ProFAR) isomerase
VAVTFQVIPAIDVSGGRLARSTADGAVPIEAFDGEPVSAARAFVDAGASWVHVVDMDLARTGQLQNLEVLTRISELGVSVQASGGLTSGSHVGAALDAGASRAVLSSGALGFRDATEKLVTGLGDRLVVGIEADGPTISPRARQARELPLWETLVWLAELEVSRFLFTEVGRVGALGGPDLDGIWALATHTGKPVLASGGIRGVEDVRAVAGLGANVEGAVIGRALYEGGLDLREALDAVG